MKKCLTAVFLAFTLVLSLSGCRTGEVEKAFPMPEQSFYDLRLTGILEQVGELYALEPYLCVSSLDVMFNKSDGKLRGVHIYLYGYDENKLLRHGYLIANVKRRDTDWIMVNPQEWEPSDGEGERAYDPEADFLTLCAMVDKMDLRTDAQGMTFERCGILSEGVRDFGFYTEDLYKCYPDGTSEPYEFAPGEGDEPVKGLIYSVYSTDPDTGMPGGAVKRYVKGEKGGLQWETTA